MQEQTSYEEPVLAWLRSKGGDVVLVAGLARKFMVGQAAMLTLLNEMAVAGKVRRSTAKRSVGFYIPSEGMLAAERRAAIDSHDRPALKVDRARRELYAEIANYRTSMPSIG